MILAKYQEMENLCIFFISGIEVLKKDIREINRTEMKDTPDTQIIERKVKKLSQSRKMQAATPLSQKKLFKKIQIVASFV